ncbi:MAG: hypothetical protein PF637_04820 [Spirochaetes bacterium]|nr:hypothetical protein [Spirochaetota bacterium]
MKRIKFLQFFIVCALITSIFPACEATVDGISEEDDNNTSSSSSSGTIRNDDDAQIIAENLNSILESIRDSLSYGSSYSDDVTQGVSGSYTVNGSASSGPIFSGSYTTEYNKNFTVSFDEYVDANGLTVHSGEISYSYEDYNTSGYHLIIEVRNTEPLPVTCDNGSYTIKDTIDDLMMGDTLDNQYIIWTSFKNTDGESFSVTAK